MQVGPCVDSAQIHAIAASMRGSELVTAVQSGAIDNPKPSQLMPHLLDPRFCCDPASQNIQKPLCDGFPKSFPGPLLGMAIDFRLHSVFVDSCMLRKLNLTADQAFEHALRNLDEETPAQICAGRISKYRSGSMGTAHESKMPHYVNHLKDTGILIVWFPDHWISIRMLLPRVVDAMAAALRVLVPELLIFALYERQADAAIPMFACACNDRAAILQIFQLTQNEQRMKPMSIGERIADPVAWAPLIMRKVDTNNGHKYVPQPYPGEDVLLPASSSACGAKVESGKAFGGCGLQL